MIAICHNATMAEGLQEREHWFRLQRDVRQFSHLHTLCVVSAHTPLQQRRPIQKPPPPQRSPRKESRPGAGETPRTRAEGYVGDTEQEAINAECVHDLQQRMWFVHSDSAEAYVQRASYKVNARYQRILMKT